MRLRERIPAVLQNRRFWLGAVAVGFALVLVNAVLALFDFGDRAFVRDVERPLQDIAYEIVMVGAAVAVFARAVVSTRFRLGWALIGASLALDAAADLFYILAFDPGQVPFPSFADALYFAAYPCAAAGLLAFRDRSNPLALSSALVVTILGLITLWSWLIFSHVVDHTTGTTAEVATTLAYPLLDVFVLAAVLVALTGRAWRLNVSFALLAAGFVAISVADGVYAWQEAEGAYQEWTILDSFWPLGSVLIAAAAWFNLRSDGRVVQTPRLATWLTTSAGALAILVLLWDHYSQLDDVTVVLASVTLVVAVLELVLLNRDRDRAETAALTAAAENEGLAAIVRSSEDAIISADLTGVVTAWNEGAERIYGWTPGEAVGRRIFGLTIPPGREDEVERLLEAAAAGEPSMFETVRQHKNGGLVDVSLRAFPMRDRDGAVFGVSVSAHDITDRRRREEAEQHDRDGRVWRGRIKTALANDNFVFYGQPVVDLIHDEVDHYELLIRMMLDDEAITPINFMPHAEASDLIHEIDHWAVGRGMEFARTVPVAINLSARSLGDRALIEQIRAGVEDHGVPPGNLTFELTETAAAENLDGARAMVVALRSLDLKVSLDDFGTGFNSFTYLKHLPVTSLKIDIEFVRKLTADPANERIVRSIVAIAHNFGMTTIAEGVEDQETLELLRELGVDGVQGYYIGYPARMTEHPHGPKAGVAY